MSFMLWQLIRDVYQHLGRSEVSTATGGTDTTLVDNKLAGRAPDDAYNGGTVIVLSASGEAPEGEIQRIVDTEGSTGTFSFESALSAPISAGDLYLRVDSLFTYRNMIEQINMALIRLGEITLVDTSLKTVSGKKEYPAATAWKRRPPIQVEIESTPGEAEDHGWEKIPWWEYVPAAAGTEGKIFFDRELPAGRTLRVWYRTSHPRVSAFDDVINELIHPAVAVAAVMVEALTWQAARQSGKNSALQRQLDSAQAELVSLQNQYPVWKPARRAKMRFAGKWV